MENIKTNELIENRIKKIDALKQMKVPLFPNDFDVSHTVGDIRKAIEKNPEDLGEDSPVFIVAGRIMAVNLFGIMQKREIP